MDDDETLLPDAHFGTATSPLPELSTDEPEDGGDDDDLDETPADVVAMLGFDPAKEDGDGAPGEDLPRRP
jgi:hypothetical protein